MPLRPHQSEALRRCVSNAATLLGHYMGTGKTLIILCRIMRKNCRAALIIVPPKVVAVWPKQYAKHKDEFCLDMDFFIPKKSWSSPRTATELIAFMKAPYKRPRVVVLSYGSFWRDKLLRALLRFDWDVMAADEIHRIKDQATRQSRGACRVGKNAACRIGGTGTMTPKNEADLFGQMKFLDPEVFGWSVTRFRSEWCIYGGPVINGAPRKFMGIRNAEKFHELLRPVAHVVTRKEVLGHLPPVTHETRTVDLSIEERRIYNDLETDMISAVKHGVITVANALTKTLRLRQCTAGIGSVEHIETGQRTERDIGTTKLEWFEDFMQDVPTDEPVVVFTSFRRTVDRVLEAAGRLGRPFGEVSGRSDTVHGFWEPKPGEILAVNWQAGGLGIDLTAGCIGVCLDPTYSGGDFDQAMSRMDREGQKRPIQYFHVLGAKTIDNVVYKAVRKKLDVSAALVEALQGATATK